MMTFAQITMSVGVAMALLGGWGALSPARFSRAIERFPRHRLSGIILCIVALVGSVFALQELALGGLEPWKKKAFYLIPVAAALICVYLDELLAVRALGGILLLLPAPWLALGRWSDSAWSYLPRIHAYVFVIVGMYWVATPYRFRLWLAPIIGRPTALRTGSYLLMALGVLQLLLAFTVL